MLEESLWMLMALSCHRFQSKQDLFLRRRQWLSIVSLSPTTPQYSDLRLTQYFTWSLPFLAEFLKSFVRFPLFYHMLERLVPHYPVHWWRISSTQSCNISIWLATLATYLLNTTNTIYWCHYFCRVWRTWLKTRSFFPVILFTWKLTVKLKSQPAKKSEGTNSYWNLLLPMDTSVGARFLQVPWGCRRVGFYDNWVMIFHTHTKTKKHCTTHSVTVICMRSGSNL